MHGGNGVVGVNCVIVNLGVGGSFFLINSRNTTFHRNGKHSLILHTFKGSSLHESIFINIKELGNKTNVCVPSL